MTSDFIMPGYEGKKKANNEWEKIPKLILKEQEKREGKTYFKQTLSYTVVYHNET